LVDPPPKKIWGREREGKEKIGPLYVPIGNWRRHEDGRGKLLGKVLSPWSGGKKRKPFPLHEETSSTFRAFTRRKL